jgi:hypothetical protein
MESTILHDTILHENRDKKEKGEIAIVDRLYDSK